MPAGTFVCFPSELVAVKQCFLQQACDGYKQSCLCLTGAHTYGVSVSRALDHLCLGHLSSYLLFFCDLSMSYASE